MKTIKPYILEKLHINKDTKVNIDLSKEEWLEYINSHGGDHIIFNNDNGHSVSALFLNKSKIFVQDKYFDKIYTYPFFEVILYKDFFCIYDYIGGQAYITYSDKNQDIKEYRFFEKEFFDIFKKNTDERTFGPKYKYNIKNADTILELLNKYLY